LFLGGVRVFVVREKVEGAGRRGRGKRKSVTYGEGKGVIG